MLSHGPWLTSSRSSGDTNRGIDSLASSLREFVTRVDFGLVMTMTGEGPWQQGKTAKFKSITEIKDADTVNFSLFMADKDGKEQPTVKITYKRKK